MPRSQPFSIRLGEDADLLVSEEVRRSGRSRSAVVEELAEEAAKTRLFPGIAFRGSPRRAWVIGTGLDVWEILQLLHSYTGDEPRLEAAHPTISERHVRLARAYGERFPEEVAAFVEHSSRPIEELRRLYPFLQFGE
jgi:Ribbon-helix-helix protein, copG family